MNYMSLFRVTITFTALQVSTAFAETFTITLPPDPNALPVFVLMEKKALFLPDDELKLVQAPAGDPSAMRAMILDKKMDFAFFNVVGGVNFVNSGMKDLKLVAPWVWKGVYMLLPVDAVDAVDAKTVDSKTVLASPGLSTPPHITSQKALAKMGIKPKFVAGGAGAALFGLLSDPAKAPAGFVAPEPMISMILAKQKSDAWAQQWRIGFDPTQALGGAIPLGALWQTHAGVTPQGRSRLVAALEKAAVYTTAAANREEVAQIGAKGYASLFKTPIAAPVFSALLESSRVEWRLDRGEAAKIRVANYLKDVFAIEFSNDGYIE